MIHRHPIIHRYNVCFHIDVYILVLCFDVRTQNNQTVLLIIQPIWDYYLFSTLPVFWQNLDQK